MAGADLSRDPTLMTAREEVRLGGGVYAEVGGVCSALRFLHTRTQSSLSKAAQAAQDSRILGLLEVRGWALVGVHSQTAGSRGWASAGRAGGSLKWSG